MSVINIEIKAKSSNNTRIRNILKKLSADFKGVDHQIDTYFQIKKGRLKLREGNIENALIHYNRENKAGPKQSTVTFYHSQSKKDLKNILSKALDIRVVVDKKREIYFIDNVKFHLDTVKRLGTFVEIEAIDSDGKIGKKKLLKQCNYYLKLFGINKKDLLSVSYSDLLLKKSQ